MLREVCNISWSLRKNFANDQSVRSEGGRVEKLLRGRVMIE
jgi:hypothetical protein